MWSSVSVIVPVYNSRSSLEELYSRVTSELERIAVKHEIILIDDGSTDNSFEKMYELHSRDSRIKVIQLEGNFGQQNAIMCGFRYANSDYIVTIDDDLQHRPELIDRLLSELSKGYDVVYGIAEKKQHSIYRNIGSKLTDYLFEVVCKKPKDIRVSSYRVFGKDLLDELVKCEVSFVYLTAITLKITRNIGNVYITHDSRKYGNSNYTFQKLFKLFIKLYIYYSTNNITKYLRVDKPQYIIRNFNNIGKSVEQESN